MKRGTPEHPKMLELADALGIEDRRLVIATIELLIHFTREYAIQGDVGRWSDARIAGACLWPADPGLLIASLTAERSRWLDSDSRHRLVLHDWAHHADDSTKKVLKNRGLDFIRPDGLPYSGPLAGLVPNDSGSHLPRARACAPAGQVRSGQVHPGQAGSGQGSAEGNGNGHRRARARLPLTAFPVDFLLSDADRAFAADGGLEPGLMLGALRDHALGKGRMQHDWHAAFRSWCRKEVAMRAERQPRRA